MQSLNPKRSMRTSPPHAVLLAVLVCALAAFTSSPDAAAPRTAQAAAQAAGAASPSIEPKAVLDRYCVGCHNARLRTADLVLEQADTTEIGARADLWEKVLRKVATGAMPPSGARRPDAATSSAFVDWLDRELARAAREHPKPGRSTIHRLNRAEYANAIRDLLGLEIDARALLPADDAGYGFDNIADVLSVSPGLLERYIGAARRIARMAVGDASMRPAVETYSVSRYLVQDDRLDERLPFGSRGGIAIPHYFPLDGEYTLKIRLQRTWRDEIRGLARPHRLDVRLDRAPLETFTIGGGGERATWLPGQAVPNPTAYELNADEGLELRFRAKAGQRVVGISFEKQTVEEEGFLRPNLPVTSFEYAGNREIDPAIDAVMIGGPYNPAGPGDTESRRRLFVCRPGPRTSETACARQILGAFARHAFRRPVNAADLDRLMSSFRTGRAGGSFERGIEFAVRRVLVSPEFLFRIERDPAGIAPATPYRISDLELASRISFFLWSSIPDDALLQAAENGQLKTTAGVEAQVARMLADPRAKALVSNFAGQWLYLRNVRNHAPDPATFPDFDDNLREAFQRETDLFIQANISEDRSVVDLLTANFTFLNERLARHYGIAGVYGSRFRRVALPDDRRAGLLGHGSVLTVTSYPTRTSPVLRGKWLLENILGTPPPPPPANVPSLNETGESGKPASVRERLELHRRDPVCASCHARMDPLGFALENFDAIGRWRSSDDGNTRLDPSGALPDGTKFEGPTGLRQVLVARGEQFAQTVTEKLLTFALGRGLESFDMPIVRAVSRNAAAKGYRWSALVTGIVTSTPFQMRLSADAPQVARSATEPQKVPQR
jgi:cytochrome c5